MQTKKKKGIYILMFSIHGLVRSENMELGRDADTGGQIKYVIELGRALGEMEEVRQVNLVTRLISDKSLSDDYAKPVESVTDKFNIVRIRCGGFKYMRKELLWPYLDEFVDETIKFIKHSNQIPDVVHGHYADGGYVAMELGRFFGIPFVFTGHSLGRVKQQRLLNKGMELEDIIKKYKIDHRTYMEEDILKRADLVVTSTSQEIQEQYAIYRNGEFPEYKVIPPGIDIEKFFPFYHRFITENDRNEASMYARASIHKELNRFFIHPDKPLILALCRPDQRKNIDGLICAYGEDPDLRTMANLAVFAGIRKDISVMEENERDVLTQMLLLMDKYDLYGKMAIPKRHDFEHEVPELYRIAAEKRGVFVNAALTEPFGITLLEALATGLPVVATNNGGPIDIIANCDSGVLVDPTDTRAIATAIKKILVHEDKWETFSKNGIMNVRKHYTWKSHAQTYLRRAFQLVQNMRALDMRTPVPYGPIGRRLAKLTRIIVSDIDHTLLDGTREDIERLNEILANYRDKIGFVIATGRVVESAVKVIKENGLPDPDVIISSVGSEMYYGPQRHRGKGWEAHVSHLWNRQKIYDLLSSFDFLDYQEEETQRPFKVSYNMEYKKDRLAAIHGILTRNKCRYNLIYSHNQFLDILPYRASKGKALRFLSYKWEIPLRNFLVCGNSGNDEEMLRGEPRAVVVGNYSPELDKLKGLKNVYFSSIPGAGGINDAIERYQFTVFKDEKDIKVEKAEKKSNEVEYVN
ncbi:MAG: HAD-IIB family hydrolase [Desulfobacteraceae bacterium]|jgi:sucrose-phosphate synthase